MKTKNAIQIVETPIIDKYDFQENNGIINPAFLASHTEEDQWSAGDNSSGRALVESDYRQSFRPKSGQTIVQYPSDDLIIEHRPNGTSVASSWVYEFNNGSSTSRAENMTASPNSMSGVYRTPYGMGYNDHLSYEMDLSRDHRKNKKGGKGCVPNGCWPTCIKLFVWTVIVVCLMGVFLSIAFIIYIEKFAADTCCSDSPSNSTGSPFRANQTEGAFEYNSVTDSSSLLELTPTLSDLTISSTIYVSNNTSKVTTNSFFGADTDNTSSEPPTTQRSLITDHKKSHELNSTEVPLRTHESTKYVSFTTTKSPNTTPSTVNESSMSSMSTTTTSSTTNRPSTTTTRTTTTTTKSSSASTTSTTGKPFKTTTQKTRKSSFDSRVLITNSSQTQKMDTESTETSSSDQINGHKSAENSSTFTSSPLEKTSNNSNETIDSSFDPFDIVAEVVEEIESSPTLDPTPDGDIRNTSSGHNTPSSKGSNNTTNADNYNETEPSINQNAGNHNINTTNTSTTDTTINAKKATTPSERTTRRKRRRIAYEE